MHPIPLLTTLILPLSILAAPSPADPIVPVEARYRITQASVRYLRDSSRGFVNKDFDFSIRGTKDGNVDIYCAGGVDVVDKVETVKMNCPQDPRLEVWVSAGTDATFDLTVQYLSVVPFLFYSLVDDAACGFFRYTDREVVSFAGLGIWRRRLGERITQTRIGIGRPFFPRIFLPSIRPSKGGRSRARLGDFWKPRWVRFFV